MLAGMSRFPVIGFIVLALIHRSLQDNLDDIRAKTDAVAKKASQRCSSVPNNEKVLSRNTISDLPLPFDPQGPIPEFRAAMYEAQKIAVNRAIFFSYILQQADLDDEPDMGYYFYSTLATLSSSDDKVMGSKIVFHKDSMQSNWYGNTTLPFFGPYGFKRFNTSQMLFAIDLGSDPSFAYTDEMRHITPNPWYAAWLSDRTAVDLPQPALLELKVLKDNSGVETINFFGPPVELPAIWTMPFFDCMFTDKWQLSVTAPIADLDRATRFLSKRQAVQPVRQQPIGNTVNTQGVPTGGTGNTPPAQLPTIASYIAAVSVELDYKKIDINQCDGELQFNTFAGTHKCKRETTVCEPLHGHGLRRGGYQCVCKSGFKYPSSRSSPFSGGEVESATAGDYAKADAFQCIPIQDQEVLISPATLAMSAANVNAIPAVQQVQVPVHQQQRPPAPQPRPPQTQATQRPVQLQQQQPQADAIPQQQFVQQSQANSIQQQQQFVQKIGQQMNGNTPRPFANFSPQQPLLTSRPTVPMQNFQLQTSPPFRPSPNFSPASSQSGNVPAPVPNAAAANTNFRPASQNQQTVSFQQAAVPQFVPQQPQAALNTNRSVPPQVPNFTPAQAQFFAAQQFQMPENPGPPQFQQQVQRLQMAPATPNMQSAASRMDPRFAVPEFDPANPRFRQDLPQRQSSAASEAPHRPNPNFQSPSRRAVRQTETATSEVPGPTGGVQPQNSAIIQQLVAKLSQDNNLMFRARQMLDNLSPRNCSTSRFAEKVDLGFSQEFNRKISKQFATQARSALRLSHFLSNYLQNGLAVEGKRRNKLTENMILGEMAAMIIAEPAIGAVSMQFEESVFPGRRFFAPTALYNKMLDELQFYHYPDNYTSFDWYRDIKTKASSLRLTDFAVDIKMRVDAAGSRFVDVPTQSFKAVTFDDMKTPFGPFYDCFYLDKFFWFEVPFYAKKVDGTVQFGGLISVGINPDQIDVNQCESAEEPLFRKTDRCDRQTTNCVAVGGRGFRAGGYKCVCKDGFEYPYVDNLQFFDGLAVEIEFQNKLLEFPNNYANLRCRRPGQKINPSLDIGSSQFTGSGSSPSTQQAVQRPAANPNRVPAASTQQQTQNQNNIMVDDNKFSPDNNPWIPNVPMTVAPPTLFTEPPPNPVPTVPLTNRPASTIPPFMPNINAFVPSQQGSFNQSQGTFNQNQALFNNNQQPNPNQPRIPPINNSNNPNFNGQPNFGFTNGPSFNNQSPEEGTGFFQTVGPKVPLFNPPRPDGSQLVPDVAPSDWPSTLNTLRPVAPAVPTTAFVPEYQPETFPPMIPTVITTGTSARITAAPSTTTSSTSTTTTTTASTTTTDRPTAATELMELVTLSTSLEGVGDDGSPSDGTTMRPTTTATTMRHAPTKYTVKVIKPTTNGRGEYLPEGEASNEVRQFIFTAKATPHELSTQAAVNRCFNKHRRRGIDESPRKKTADFRSQVCYESGVSALTVD
ncbi:hypothetical protein BV898_00818 [Hypsibius exemplaris]|uniref:GPR158/179 extracellular domain-containing protein n=1 Tax=Hypsibius exemplaris TaxID=2072580 RepID=A0A1W0XCB7_HYPEX|nr:hypothetical protein BV898_00818 [Hypsibius exemplaris]